MRLEVQEKMPKSCYYCGIILELNKFPEKCPKCNTHTRWQTKEQCLKSVVEAEKRRWANT